jgi:beta-galactosidase
MYVREKLFALILIFLSGSLTNCTVTNDDIVQKQLFDLNWKFSQGIHKIGQEADFNDTNWRSIDLPHDWSTDSLLKDFTKKAETVSLATETGWYRKNFEIPEKWIGKKIIINFEGISGQHEIFINGVSIKLQEIGTCDTKADLTPNLNPKGNNLIAIRLVVPKDPGYNWKTETGIFRHVWLVIKNKSDFKE